MLSRIIFSYHCLYKKHKNLFIGYLCLNQYLFFESNFGSSMG